MRWLGYLAAWGAFGLALAYASERDVWWPVVSMAVVLVGVMGGERRRR